MMTSHSSPFSKHPAELLANKSEKIFTFSAEPHPLEPEPRPLSRTSSFYNGYSSPKPADLQNMRQCSRQTSPSPGNMRLETGSVSPGNMRLETGSASQRASPSPRGDTNVTHSPRRLSQSDCTEKNCLNLFHQHNIEKSPRSKQIEWETRNTARTPSPNTARTPSPNTVRTPSPTKEPPSDLDRLSQAIRNMDKLYLVDSEVATDSGDVDSGRFSVECGEVRAKSSEPCDLTETHVAFGESINFDMSDKFAILNGRLNVNVTKTSKYGHISPCMVTDVSCSYIH